MIKTNRLPQGYKELEYIVSDSSQFIANTYTIPTSATSFDVKTTLKPSKLVVTYKGKEA